MSNTTVITIISSAVYASRANGQIQTIHCNDWDAALEYLQELVDENEDYDYVENGETLEFWAYNKDLDDDSMSFRVHVERY